MTVEAIVGDEDGAKVADLKLSTINQDGKEVVTGMATVRADG